MTFVLLMNSATTTNPIASIAEGFVYHNTDDTKFPQSGGSDLNPIFFCQRAFLCNASKTPAVV
jgi:hypothetical protein